MRKKTDPDDRCREPLKVIAHEDAVVLMGPSSAALALTPQAALASAQALLEAARIALARSAAP